MTIPIRARYKNGQVEQLDVATDGDEAYEKIKEYKNKIKNGVEIFI